MFLDEFLIVNEYKIENKVEVYMELRDQRNNPSPLHYVSGTSLEKGR